jgi:hypothetical protein
MPAHAAQLDASRRISNDAMARRTEKIGVELTRKTAVSTAGERYSIMVTLQKRGTQVAESTVDDSSAIAPPGYTRTTLAWVL